MEEPRPARMHKHTHVHHADALAHPLSLLNNHRSPSAWFHQLCKQKQLHLQHPANGEPLSRPSPCLTLGVVDPALWFAPPHCNQSCQILSNPFVNQASEQPRNQSINPPTTPPANTTRAATCRPCYACSPRLWPSHWQCCCSSPTPACTPSPTGVCCETSEARFSQRPAARGCSGNPCAPASTSPNSKPCSNMVNLLKHQLRTIGFFLRTQTRQC